MRIHDVNFCIKCCRIHLRVNFYIKCCRIHTSFSAVYAYALCLGTPTYQYSDSPTEAPTLDTTVFRTCCVLSTLFSPLDVAVEGGGCELNVG